MEPTGADVRKSLKKYSKLTNHINLPISHVSHPYVYAFDW
jgi:hypothetical protein